MEEKNTPTAIDKIGLGLFLLLPAGILFSCFVLAVGPLSGTIMLMAPIIFGSAYFIGDICIQMMER